jgi:hypothetical protein
METSMDATKYIQSPWLSGMDLDSKEWDLTIERVIVEPIRNSRNGKEESRLAVQFKAAKKPMLLNLTNGKLLIGVLGKETNNWPGAICHMRADAIRSFGKDQLSIVITTVSKRNGAAPTPAENQAADQAIAATEPF